MKFDSLKPITALLLSGLILTGCESMDTQDENLDLGPDQGSMDAGEGNDDAVDTATYAAPDEEKVSAEEMAEQEAIERAMKEQAALREVRTFYFDFDQSSVKVEARASLAAHAEFLAANPAIKIVLEGHTDERGTKEYNIALGEGRAKSISSFLVVNGVSRAQIEVVSYGEERPADMAHTDAAWAQNRRAYIEYK
ncbi:MAG: peptidoglycan-associated lipoprotein [Pseudohongiellaceae bacterium]|jgi:peptidoglycan-associated lipoprotein